MDPQKRQALKEARVLRIKAHWDTMTVGEKKKRTEAANKARWNK